MPSSSPTSEKAYVELRVGEQLDPKEKQVIFLAYVVYELLFTDHLSPFFSLDIGLSLFFSFSFEYLDLHNGDVGSRSSVRFWITLVVGGA